jgi:MHS family citrate/tricarballylate:H+ symporter-like MFS transporter
MTVMARDGGAPRVRGRHVLAVFIGNGLEFYDFVVFAFFAVYISRTFYPNDDPSTALLVTLATFGAGFLTRPIGAIVIGSMGDRMGRKPAILLSFSLMGIGITGLALTPSYAAIGIAAPYLVLFFRLLQGFALGGEVGPTTAYMAEAAPPEKRARYLSMQYVTQNSASLLAGLVGTGLALALTEQQLQDWGWRAAMLLGSAIVPFGLLIRRALPETMHSADDATFAPDAGVGAATRWERLSPYLALALLGLAMLAAGTIGTYTVNYMTTYALNTLGLAASVAFGFTIVSGLTFICFNLLGGWLADRFGRKPIMIVPATLLLLSIIPGFWIFGHFDDVWVLYLAQAIMVALLATSAVPVLVTITESLPKAIRSGALATIYAVAISIFGGSTQYLVAWLIDVTGDPLAPAYLWSGAAAVGLTAMVLVPESSPVRRRASSNGLAGNGR